MVKKSVKEVAAIYGAELGADFEFKSHVFPRYLCPVIGAREGVRVVKPYQFGLIPHFEKNEKPKMVFHNARVETLHEKPSFQAAFRKQRCLIPLESFFEYVAHEGKSRLVRFFPKDRSLLTAAGIFSTWKSPKGILVPTFSMITRPASPFILEAGHDRSPFFLKADAFDAWISEGVKSDDELYSILNQGANPVDFSLSSEGTN